MGLVDPSAVVSSVKGGIVGIRLMRGDIRTLRYMIKNYRRLRRRR
jgi:hypothetical protein